MIGSRVMAVGDVHGQYEKLKKLMRRIKFDPSQDMLIFLGDLIDRGPESLQCFDYAMLYCKLPKCRDYDLSWLPGCALIDVYVVMIYLGVIQQPLFCISYSFLFVLCVGLKYLRLPFLLTYCVD